MRYKSKVFEEKLAIRYFMEDEFMLIPRENLMDVVMDIRTHEMEILDNWEAHFKAVRVPHAVTESTNDWFGRPYTDYRIWIERKAGE